MSTAATSRCDVCTSERYQVLFTKHGCPIVQCQSCGHVYLDLPISDEHLLQLYAQSYFSGGIYADYVGERAALEKNFRRFIAWLRHYRDGGRLLEIGCAYGFFLALARQYWQVRGIDINKEAVTYARERLGVDATCAEFLELGQDENSYDVVAMWGTIALLRSPSGYIKKIARILKPGGILALTTADVSSLLARIQGSRWRFHYPPYQRHCFSRKTITQLLARCGLEVVEIRSVGSYRSLDQMLYRLLVHGKPRLSRALYQMAKRLGVTKLDFSINLFDFMLVVARKG